MAQRLRKDLGARSFSRHPPSQFDQAIDPGYSAPLPQPELSRNAIHSFKAILELVQVNLD